MQRHQFELDAHGRCHVAGQRCHAELMHLARRHVGRHADVALAAAQHQRHGGRVVAGVNGKALGRFLDQPWLYF